jgi:ribosomal protein S18 acetylase RimI-like enzyme
MVCIYSCSLFLFVSAELGTVADIFIDSFYTSKTSWKKLYRLAELNRLQQNFPYKDTDLHQMLVAVSVIDLDNRTIVGFCDVDARPCQTHPPLPRPYLSDLAVDPQYRRLGIASALVQMGESFLQNVPRDEVFIRVDETNESAMNMYKGLGYETVGIDKYKDNKIFRLWKKLNSYDTDKD